MKSNLESKISEGIYQLPFKSNDKVKRTTAPSHTKYRPYYPYAIDWYMPEGTPIYAARGGVIMLREARYNTFGGIKFIEKGNYVEILHENKEVSLYGHFKWRGVTVKKGEYVKKGQLIGYSGQTGFALYPHLHFAVYKDIGDAFANIKPIFSKNTDIKYLTNPVCWKKFEKK